jgi:aspartate/tyrosine/aromatic aminotransferase
MAEPTGLHAAAQRKRDATLARARRALAELADKGAQITFQSVARHAGVTRQWLYEQPELRAQIEQLRSQLADGVPARQRSSDASLQQRLRTVLDDNAALRSQVRELKHELALAYGAHRAPAALAPQAAAAVSPARGSCR